MAKYGFTIQGTLPGLNDYLKEERKFRRGHSCGNDKNPQYLTIMENRKKYEHSEKAKLRKARYERREKAMLRRKRYYERHKDEILEKRKTRRMGEIKV